jgi:hypothetical protein
MSYAMELFLNDLAADRVRQIWTALDEQGIRSLGSVPGAAYHPHVTPGQRSG